LANKALKQSNKWIGETIYFILMKFIEINWQNSDDKYQK
jgi:hypothetical protein